METVFQEIPETQELITVLADTVLGVWVAHVITPGDVDSTGVKA